MATSCPACTRGRLRILRVGDHSIPKQLVQMIPSVWDSVRSYSRKIGAVEVMRCESCLAYAAEHLSGRCSEVWRLSTVPHINAILRCPGCGQECSWRGPGSDMW